MDFWTHWWNIGLTKVIFYLCSFFEELTYRSDPSTGFHAWWLTRRGLTQGCAVLGFVHTVPHLWVKTPKTPNFGAWIGIFKQTRKIEERAYYQNHCIDSNQILHSDKDHQMPFVDRPKPHHKFNMADGRHLEKIKKLPYLGRGFSDYNEIWHGDAVRPLDRSDRYKFKISKIQDGDSRHAEKSKNCGISSTVSPIGTAFGINTHIGPPNQTSSWNFELLIIIDGGRPPSCKVKNVVLMDIINGLLKTGNKTANIC